MQIVQHHVEVAADVDRAFALCRDVERWPELFPPCKAARILEQDTDRQLIEISADANGELFTWRSRRRLDQAARLIAFEQVTTAPLVERMEGTWRFFPVGGGSLVALEHRFAARGDIDGLVAGVETPADALAFIARTVDHNSRRELRAIRQILEAPDGDDELRAAFEEELVIAAPARDVFRLLADAGGWPALLPHCEHVGMRYDDGVDQEFVMTVKVGAGEEEIRTVRRCSEPHRITYFQPQPPPALSVHRGEWRLDETTQGTVVVSRHEIELRPAGVRRVWGDIELGEARTRVTRAINQNSRATMAAIRDALEQNGGRDA